jgi:predicted RNase H-like nuclease (RuvC/YqgF family)
MDDTRRSRYQFSIRTLLLVTVAVALLLVPVTWVTRERLRMVEAQREILAAREVALRSVVREQALRQRALASVSPQPASAEGNELESLKRQNADLKQEVKQLRRELERLQARSERAVGPGD